MTGPLPPSLREALRWLADGQSVPSNRLARLVDAGLATTDGQLTDQGRVEHRRVMASGDGPEALKELLRLDGGPR